ncbi:MAG: FAD-binding oxidoreductase [Pseudomonadota bacterium]
MNVETAIEPQGLLREAAAPAPEKSLKETPYWWDDLVPLERRSGALPRAVDVAVVGAGYTGLSAALQTARGGRKTLVFDAESAGWGCSTRNGGQISTSVKPTFEELARRHGKERARAIRQEGTAALDWIESFVEREGIDCDFRRSGRFHAAHTPRHYEALVKSIQRQENGENTEAFAVPRQEQRRELGTDVYHGGVVFPKHASLHPAKFHRDLLSRVLNAGGQIMDHTPVLNIERYDKGFTLTTPKGTLAARDVIVATNGYTDKLTPWLRRRVIPIGSYVIATEPLERSLVEQLFPTDRIVSDTCRVVYYYRASPDRSRIIFGGRVSARETDPKVSGPLLKAELGLRFPELRDVGMTHSWVGTVAYSFDQIAHTGIHDGIHYAMGYCGSGVSMASYLGMRMGLRVLGRAEGKTGFDELPFPTRPLYSGSPWFLPAVVAWYRWRDRREQHFAV